MNDEELARICQDNRDAIRLCQAWIAHCHFLDDVIDGDHPENLTDEKVIGSSLSWFLETQQNPFWRQHAARLLVVVEIAYSAWIDANTMERSDQPEEVVGADVLKGFYHEFVYAVARIIGGWDHMRDVAKRARGYDWDSLESVNLNFKQKEQDNGM